MRSKNNTRCLCLLTQELGSVINSLFLYEWHISIQHISRPRVFYEVPRFFAETPLDKSRLSIMYCFIAPYGDMVFACNPDSCANVFVYPLAKNFEDFLRLILACGSTNPIEQIVWMDKEKFTKHLKEEEAVRTEKQKALLKLLKKELNLSPIENSYEYVEGCAGRF